MITVDDLDRFVFIVGAPRCGTTTLSRFLKQHPSINFPAIKEPHFFARHDLRSLVHNELKREVESEYLQRFFHKDPARRVGADGSVTYLYKPEQLEPVLRIWPDSRFIVALRNPLTMLPSLHLRLIYVGEEAIANFANAWAAVPDRSAGRRIPRTCTDPRLLRYDEAARFSTYLERLFATVGRERCLVVIFDDLTSQPAEQYRRVMEFAGLEPQTGIDFTPHRRGQAVRYPWLQRVLKRPPRAITERLVGELNPQRAGGEADDRKVFGKIMSLRRRLLLWNSIPASTEALSPAMHNEICRTFGDEVERLGTLLGRDLSHWLRPVDESRKLATDHEDELVELKYQGAHSI